MGRLTLGTLYWEDLIPILGAMVTRRPTLTLENFPLTLKGNDQIPPPDLLSVLLTRSGDGYLRDALTSSQDLTKGILGSKVIKPLSETLLLMLSFLLKRILNRGLPWMCLPRPRLRQFPGHIRDLLGCGKLRLCPQDHSQFPEEGVPINELLVDTKEDIHLPVLTILLSHLAPQLRLVTVETPLAPLLSLLSVSLELKQMISLVKNFSKELMDDRHIPDTFFHPLGLLP